MPGVNRVTDFHEKSSMRPLERVTAACGSKDPADCFTFVPVKFLRKDAIEIIKNGAVKTRVAKEFDGVVFAGTVTEYLPKEKDDDCDLWQILYDDKDEEQWNKNELAKGIMLFKEDPPVDDGELEDESDSECRGDTARVSDESSGEESSDNDSSDDEST